MDKVVVIGGPTASGKSALATQIAQEKGGAILNGDSLQVYAGLEILTDQPSYELQGEIPHRLYGFLDPTQPYSAGMWLAHVLKEIEECHQKGLLPIVVGGTGLYLRTLLEGITPIPSIDPHIREYLLTRDSATQEILYHELQARDSLLAARIHPHDRQRTLRGLEVFYGTGKPLSFWQTQKPQPYPYEFDTILCMPSKEDHRAKIAERIEGMLVKGVLEEIKAVLSLRPSSTAMKAIGLRELGAYLEGKCSLEEAKELTFIHTCQYAKRQRTWFRHQFKG
ncbi:MAG: tRNA (adenosine(37)-N6)-dimethylallyltransferase MiaA [Alphaproteobacteria bacterium]|nr:tRNA (adenosine(37)-N6)-dimethylallyltransferase MiaA [Alphaproteobacteria bacterium]